MYNKKASLTERGVPPKRMEKSFVQFDTKSVKENGGRGAWGGQKVVNHPLEVVLKEPKKLTF